MDYTGLVIAIAIGAYGVLTYRLREHRFRTTMACLSRGEKPPEKAANPQVWRLVAVGCAGLILAVGIALITKGVKGLRKRRAN